MAFEIPSLLLKLNRHADQKEWAVQQAASLRGHDWTWTIVNAIMCASICYRYSVALRHLLWIYVPCEAILSTGMLWVQLWCPNMYLRKRGFFIASVRLARIGLTYLLFLQPGNEDLTDPPERITPTSSTSFSWSIWVAFIFLRKVLLALFQAWGYRAPVRQHLWLQGLPLLLVLISNGWRCNSECSINPAFYGSMYTSLAQWLAPLQGLGVIAPHTIEVLDQSAGPHTAVQLSCRSLCHMLHGSIQFFLGYVVSTLLLAALEEPACMKFLRERGGTPLFRGAGALMLFSLALLPLLASLTLSLFSALTLLQAVFVT